MRKIEFTRPYIDEDIIQSVTDTLRSGWITTGPKVANLEAQMCSLFQIKKCLCLNSWTNAAEAILRWFGVKDGDEVIVPVMTYCATANIVLHCGAKVIMVDINDNMNINVDKIKEKINTHTKVIIPVDIGGLPCDYNNLIDIVRSDEIRSKFTPSNDNQNKLGRILILSDAAHSIGAKYNNSYACNYADFAVFSFHAVKNITTAEGGAISFNLPEPFDNGELYKYFKIFTLHGQNKTAMDKYGPNGVKHNYWEYDVIATGYKFNMPDILACIALEQLKKFQYLMEIRRDLCRRYYNTLKKYTFIKFPIQYADIDNSSCHLFIIQIDVDEDVRNNIINKMADLNILMNIHFKPLPLLTVYKSLNYDMNDYPNAYNIYKNIVSLPLHFNLTSDDIDYICSNLYDVINSSIGK